MRRIPRWLLVLGWFIGLPIVYAAAPFGLSLLSARHRWHHSRPGLVNLLGFVPVAFGAVVVIWVFISHYRRLPREGSPVGNPFAGPGYVLSSGPYALCRHPMHLGGILIWFGWALFYGSISVLIAAAGMTLTFVALVPSEERGLESAMGEEYRAYMKQVPRWGIGRRGDPSEARAAASTPPERR